MKSSLRFVAFFTTVVLVASVAAAFLTRLDAAAARLSSDQDPVYLPQAEYLRPMSLGYHNALADLLWFRAISYFGEHYRSDRTYPWLGHMCDLVTDLDPRAEHVYRFAGLILPWEAGQVDKGIELLEKGTKALPDSWQLAYFLGFTYFFFKGDNQRALPYLKQAASFPEAHSGVARFAAVVSAQELGPEQTIRFLIELEQSVGSGSVREVIRENMKEMALAHNLSQLNEAIEAYREQNRELPPSIDALVGAGLITGIPPDPFGGHFEIDPASGTARSSTGKVPSQLHTSRIRERALEGKSGDELLMP